MNNVTSLINQTLHLVPHMFPKPLSQKWIKYKIDVLCVCTLVNPSGWIFTQLTAFLMGEREVIRGNLLQLCKLGESN